MLSDDELLDFTTENIAHWEPGLGERLLDAHGALYRNHLVIAKNFDLQRKNHEINTRSRKGATGGEDGLDIADRILADNAARLRCGDYLPGGLLYEQTIGAGGRL